MDMAKYEKIFTQESEKYLNELDTLLLEAENDLGNRELWSEIHGKVHSIKGMARSLSLDRITGLSHSIENWCRQFQQGDMPATSDAVRLILEGVELLRVLVAGKGEMDSPKDQRWYDTLGPRFAKRPDEIAKDSSQGDRSYYSMASVPERIDEVRIKYPLIEELLGFSQDLLFSEKTLPPIPKELARLRNWINNNRAMLKGLYLRLTQLRLMSVGDFVELFVKSARDLARQYKKKVKGEVVGGEVEADIALLEHLREPVIHLLRNSIIHGIEPPEERIRTGKEAEGKITLEARRERGSLLLKIGDDGRGLNRSAIIQYLKARRGLTDEKIAEMPENEFFNAIISTDFSSADKISDMAGRGIGMSVVSQAIAHLGGSMSIRSEPSKGTQFIIRVPLILSVIYAVLFKIDKYSLCIPTSYVESVERRESALAGDDGSFYDLRGLLGIWGKAEKPPYILRLTLPEQDTNRPGTDPHALPAAAGHGKNGRLLLAVDSIMGNTPIVVMGAGELIARAGVFSGVGIAENGDLSILLDLENLPRFPSRPSNSHQDPPLHRSKL